MRQAKPPQVHQEERQIIENVDRRDFVVELNRIEERRLAVTQHDVAEVKVAMAVANQALVAAPVQQDAAAIEHEPCTVGEPRALDRVEDSGAFLLEPGGIAIDDAAHGFPAAVIGRAVGRVMESRDGMRQRTHQVEGEHARLGQAIEEAALIETRHLHQPVDRRAGAADRQLSVRLPRDGGDATIEGRSYAPIDAHFCLAHGAPVSGGRVIEIVVANGPLQLPGALARKEHHRGVRVDPLDRGAGVGGWASSETPRRSIDLQ